MFGLWGVRMDFIAQEVLRHPKSSLQPHGSYGQPVARPEPEKSESKQITGRCWQCTRPCPSYGITGCLNLCNSFELRGWDIITCMLPVSDFAEVSRAGVAWSECSNKRKGGLFRHRRFLAQFLYFCHLGVPRTILYMWKPYESTSSSLTLANNVSICFASIYALSRCSQAAGKGCWGSPRCSHMRARLIDRHGLPYYPKTGFRNASLESWPQLTT